MTKIHGKIVVSVIRKLATILLLLAGALFAQNAALLPQARLQFFDASGRPLAGGKLYFYTAGTTTPQAVYADAGLSVPLSNPVTLDAGGFAPAIYITTNSYKVVAQNSFGVQQWSQDNVSGGLGVVNFQASQNGGVIRSAHDKLADIVSVMDFGAKGDGLTDDTTAIQNAINSVSGSGSVLFPAGTYKVTSTITLKTGVSLSGYGATIYPATANMTLFNLSYGSATSANLSITGFVIDPQGITGVTGISFTFVKDATVRDIFFRAVAKTVAVDRAGNGITIDKCTSSGNLAAGKAGQLLIWSSVDTDYVNYVNVDHYTVFNTGTGVTNPAIYLRRAVAVHVSHVGANDMHVGGDATGVLIENDCQGVRVTDSIFGSGSTAITIQTGTGVNVAPSFITVTSVDSDQMTLAGFYVVNGNWVSFSNGKITSSGATPSAAGILLQNAAGSYFQITGMQINGFNGVSGSGISFSGANQLEIANNKISSCTTPIGANGTNTAVRIHNNEFAGFTSGNPITGTMTGSGNWVYHNVPAQSAVTVTPAIPASNAPVTNTTGYTVRYSISGGTFSQILIDGTAMGTGATFGYLDPGETITITYTVAPTWVWLIEP